METAAMAIVNPAMEEAKMAFSTTIRYAMFCRDNMNSLQRRVNKLQSRVKDVKKKLEEAEREDQIATFEFENWEDDVKKIGDDAEELKAELGSMTTCIGGCTPNIVSRALLSQKAEHLTILAKELYENIPQISHNFDPDHFVERQTCVPFVGRDSVLQQLQQLALDNTKSSIGVYGMAGVGKTQLLNKFFNNFHLSNPDLRIVWVDMKDCRSVEDTQKAISQRLALRWNENDKQEARANRIFWNLNKKSFLLILDDVWVAMDFKDVGIPIATQETQSKVIVATRREDICDTMEAAKLHVECLDSEVAWSLFIDKAGRELIESEPEIRHLAEKLVEKCGGLPLALITIGRAMATMKTPGLWKHAVTTLENTPQKIRGMNEVLSRLKRSYDSLDDDKLKTCLLYCTMFKEGSWLERPHIIDYCIGEGVLVDRFYDGDHVYDEGYNLINVLKSASMLETEAAGTSYFLKIHPIIRILSHWIESGTGETKCLIRASKGLIEAPAVDDWSGVERISLMDNSIETLSEKPDSPSLLTLLLRRNPLNKICDGFFRSMTNLRVLDLGNTSIQEVPAEIGELIQLQHLDFSFTNITSLPKELGNLIRLRYLGMSFTPHLNIIPEGLIAKLSKLRVLYMNCSYDGWKVDAAGQGLGYDELHCLKRLKSLGITVSTTAGLRKLSGSNRLANCILKLEIKHCPGLRSTLSTETLGCYFKALQRLGIERCFALEELSISGSLEGHSALQDLTFLSLSELPRAKITWNGGHLQSLRWLYIYECGEMRHLLHNDDEATEKEDEEEMVREINALPNLYELHLSSLPELESLSCGKRPLAFPSLAKLIVTYCPKLKKIPLNAEELLEIRGQISWWNELEWPEDNDAIKSKFQSIFEEELLSDSYVERPAVVGWEMMFQDLVLEQLQQLAVDDRVSIIGIYGMAGVGKTTHLHNFFYQFHSRDEYQMIWIDMDVSHSVEDTQKAVAEKLEVNGYQDKSREELTRIISEFLNLKNFILILDNLWEVVDLNAVGIPTTTCQVKHKVILATRIEDICDRMVASKLHIKCLEWNEAWSLFVEKVGQKLIDSDPMIQRHAAALVERCGGLPLALVTIGRAMTKKRTPKMWENAVKALENNPLQIRGMMDMFSCLKRSFDHLVDDNLRTCLFYCVLLWEDGDIGKEFITNYLVGEGVLDGIDLYNEGQKLLHVLKANSMLLDGSDHNFVKVHPMIRIFVLWNAGDGMLMRAKKGLTEIPDAVEWRGAKRVLLFGNNIKALSGSPESPALLTLFLYNNPIEKICSGFFQNMKNLRVLDLSSTSIQEVPVEIGELITLQYLNLSCTRISSLPKELGNLTRLRFLGLYKTLFLKKIPEGLILSLTDLRALSMCRSYTGWKVEAGGDGVDFEELHCLKLLKAIWMTVTTAITWQRLITSPRLANCTNGLEIKFSQGLATLSTATIGSEFKALKYLRLHQCNDLQELVIDNDSCAGLSTLPDLDFIKFSELPIAKIVWRSGCLQGLIFLKISRCGGIRQLICCDDEPIEEGEAVKEVLEEINILPNLQHLSLFYLPGLESLSCGSKPLAFPSLQLLEVVDCPKLKRLPSNAEKLQRIIGQRSWWNRLEWSEANNMEAKYKSVFEEAHL